MSVSRAPIQLGQLLLRAQVITEAQLSAALDQQRQWGGKLGETLVRMTFLTEGLLVRALSRQLGIPWLELDAIDSIAPEVLQRLPVDLATTLRAVPLELEGKRVLATAMVDPTNLLHLDTLQAVSGCRISPRLAEPAQIQRLIARAYHLDAGPLPLEADATEPKPTAGSSFETS